MADDNATRNEVVVPTAVGSADAAIDLLGAPADVLLANLVTDTVAELAASLVGALAPEGILVASGIAADRAHVATGPLEAAGLRIDERRERDGWVALRGTRVRTSGPDARADGAEPGSAART